MDGQEQKIVLIVGINQQIQTERTALMVSKSLMRKDFQSDPLLWPSVQTRSE